jgi:hypothetical protein
MAVFTIQSPDGRRIKIEAADEATAIRGAQEWAAANPPQASGPIDQGPNVKRLTGGVEPGSYQGSSHTPNVLDIARDPTLMDQVGAFGQGIADLPIVGPWVSDRLMDVQSGAASAISGRDYNDVRREADLMSEYYKERAGGSRLAGQIAGTVAATAPLGAVPVVGRALGMSGGLGSRAGFGALSGGAITGADTLARGGTLEEARNNALLGGGLGLAAPVLMAGAGHLARGVTQNRAVSAAIKDTPSATELRSAGSALFEQSRHGTVAVNENAFFRLMGDIQEATKRFRPNAQLDPKSTGALQVLRDAADQLSAGGNTVVDIQDLHIFRQAAQKAAISGEGRDAAIANRIIDQIDEFVRALRPGDMAGNVDPRNAANALLEGISTWHLAGKMSLLEEAIRSGSEAASGAQNGIQNAFRNIIRNPRMFNQFSEAEKAAIQEVARGTPLSNVAKILGKFGFAPNNWLGGMIGAGVGGAAGGLPGAIAAGAVGAGGRKAAELLTRRSADRAVRIAGTPNVPAMPPRNQRPSLVAPGTIAALALQQR